MKGKLLKGEKIRIVKNRNPAGGSSIWLKIRRLNGTNLLQLYARFPRDELDRRLDSR